MVAVTIPAGAVTCRDGDPRDTRKTASNISPGQVVYIDAANANQFNLADKNDVVTAAAVGIAVGDATLGEFLTIAKSGSRITVASPAFTAGTAYYVGDSGAIIPEADIASLDFVTYLGVGASTQALDVQIHVTGITK